MAHSIYNHTFNIIVSIISSININIIAVTLITIIFITIHNGYGFWRRFMGCFCLPDRLDYQTTGRTRAGHGRDTGGTQALHTMNIIIIVITLFVGWCS